MTPLEQGRIARRRRWSLLPRRHAQNWEIYASLLFLFFYFTGAPHASAAGIAASVLAALVFLALYFASYWVPPSLAAAPIAAIALLGTLLLGAHPGASVFLCYAASLACYLFPLRYGVACAVAVLAVFLLRAGAAGYPQTYLAMNSLVIVAVAAIYLQARRSALITERLHLREAELASIHRASERRRIAHDLHDQLAQKLVVISLKADLARRQPGAADQGLAEIGEAARDTLATVRRVVSGYSARAFVEDLRQAEELLRLSGVEPVIDAQLPDSLTERQECFLALIMGEAVTNVVRHARAKSCRIHVQAEAGQLVLEVADDGRGSARYEGFGTDGMRERAAEIGGALEIRRERGTRVILRLPL
ncbi:two-component system sensor histidine kinase DesK [Caulobacter ginsengisoli]|uniref:Two-component system sensor histidine kinase DesK n=1 Tax=Caulobacter ginsengisoli TaxID=400775 RepID=A0ABU0IMU8_9CAUL|nr:histidine kinase [Caulobacter ginsengisoli]MDQ0463327.1 two-component system sensor histidine kinase DesK [Caulobacter ginsengisoli]